MKSQEAELKKTSFNDREQKTLPAVRTKGSVKEQVDHSNVGYLSLLTFLNYMNFILLDILCIIVMKRLCINIKVITTELK